MSTRKRKPAQPQPIYSVGQKVFTLMYHKGKPEEITEAKVFAVKSRKIADKDYLGKAVGTKTEFTYSLQFPDGLADDKHEVSLYPSFIKAAEVFGKSFLTLFK